jgi:hypothetical protein
MIGEEKSKTHFLLYFPISLSVVLKSKPDRAVDVWVQQGQLTVSIYIYNYALFTFS